MQEKIRERIDSFEQWHYQFDLKGELTPAVRGEKSVRRHQQRKKHFFAPMVELFGGSLKGKRVLDLGCNAGFWSLNAIKAGCDFVLGIDGRRMHIEQAEFVFETKDIDPARYCFEHHNLFELDFSTLDEFDIVLCLGLLYHVNRPIELFQRIASVNTDFLLIDTAVDGSDASILRLVARDHGGPAQLRRERTGLLAQPQGGVRHGAAVRLRGEDADTGLRRLHRAGGFQGRWPEGVLLQPENGPVRAFGAQ